MPLPSFQQTKIGGEIIAELALAMTLHGPLHGPHEGYAVILEELDELWDLVRAKRPDKKAMRNEAIQIAAMAARFILEVTG